MKLFFLCIYFTAIWSPTSAQNDYHPLSIGDTIPDVELKYIRNYQKDRGRLSDFKGKYIILDFWNRYCSSCISAFPILQQLQTSFKEDVQVLLVTSNNLVELNNLFLHSPTMKNTTLPMVLEDSILGTKLFPHMTDPYQVWVDKNGVIRATTDSRAATYKNVQDFIQEKPLQMKMRKDIMDIDLNAYGRLLHANDGRYLKYLLYYRVNDSITIKDQWSNNPIDELRNVRNYSMIMREIPGYQRVGTSAVLDSITRQIIGYRVFHMPPLRLYSIAYNLDLSKTRIFVEKKDVNTLLESEDLFSYETIIPNCSLVDVQQVMKRDLQSFFGMKGHWEERKLPYLIVYRTGNIDRLKSKGGMVLVEDTQADQGHVYSNVPLRAFVVDLRLNNPQQDDPLVIDETGIGDDMNVDMNIKCDFNDIPRLRIELMNYGLGLKQEKRSVKVLVLTKE